MSTPAQALSRLSWPLSLMLCMSLLSACQWQVGPRPAAIPPASQKAMGNAMPGLPLDPATMKGGIQRAERDAAQQLKPEVLRHSKQPWIAMAPQPLRDEQRLPDIFYQPFVLNYAMDDVGMSLDMLALRMSQITRMPVRILPDVYVAVDKSVAIDESESVEETERMNQEAARAAAGQKRSSSLARAKRYEVQEVPPHILRWRGHLKGFLNHLTDRIDLSWSYDDGAIVLSRFQTEAFELAMFPMRGRFGLRSTSSGTGGSRSSGGSSSGSSSNSTGGASTGSVTGAQTVDFTEQGQIDAYDSTLALIENLVATVPGSQVYVTQGSGRILVRSSRAMLKQLRDIIRSENSSLTRQVLVQVDIYNVTNTNKRQFSVDWSLLYERLVSNAGVALKSTAGNGASGVFSLGESSTEKPARDISTVLNALNELGYNVQHRPVSVMAMNRQWVRKAKLFSQSYLAETTPGAASALGSGTGVPGLKASTVTVGDQIMLMPYILENNSVMLKFTVSFSDLLGLDRIETGEGLTRQLLQIPTTTTVQDNFTVNIKPGEVLAITGLGNQAESQSRKGLAEGASTWWGGQETDERRYQHFLVFLRVVLL